MLVCPPTGVGLERIEQQVGNDLNDFISKAHDYPLCLNALTMGIE
jgi:hypothetical protein